MGSSQSLFFQPIQKWKWYSFTNRLEHVYPNGRWFLFYNEIRNSTDVPKRPFVFLKRNTKFCRCTQTAVHFFFTEKYEILQMYLNGRSLLQRNTKFDRCIQTIIRFFTAKYKILKTVITQPIVLDYEIRSF